MTILIFICISLYFSLNITKLFFLIIGPMKALHLLKFNGITPMPITITERSICNRDTTTLISREPQTLSLPMQRRLRYNIIIHIRSLYASPGILMVFYQQTKV